MATLRIHYVLLWAGLVSLVGADTSVEEYKKLKDDIFGKGYDRFYDTFIEEKIHTMIKLIETGSIPAELQGDQTLGYLKSLTNDCVKGGTCDLDEDLKRAERSSGRDTGAPNLRNYLQLCQVRIENRCELDIFKRTSAKLSAVDDETMKAVDLLALQLYDEIEARDFGQYNYKPGANYINTDADHINYATVLRALKRLDPVGSKAMLKRWTKKKATLAKFMDQIRLPCIKFLEHVDPSVKLLPPDYDYSEVSKWHSYLNCCEKVVNEWDTIFEDAYSSYTFYLADPKPEKTSCFSGWFDGSGGDGGGVSTSTLIWMSAGR